MKNIAVLIVALPCLVANALGNSQGLAKSSSTALDLSYGTVEYALGDVETVPVEYGSLYGDVEDGTAQFLVNDAVVASGGEASTHDWKPTAAGTYVLKHRMLVDGVETGTVLTVTHVVTANPEPSPTSGSATSAAVSLDLTVGTVEYALSDAETIPVEYGSLYGDIEYGTARFLVNDTIVASGGEASTYDWKPTAAGTYILKHQIIVDGVKTGTVLTVTHIVTAAPEPTPTFGSATSAPIALDLVSTAASYALAESETIPVEYGGLYGDVEAGQAQLILNGAIIRTGGWTSVYDLKPAVTGVFDFVHRMVDNGVVTGTVLLARVEVTALGGVYVMPILDDPTEDEIKEVLVVAKDANLVAKVTNETEYVAFREWSGKVRPHGGGDAVGAAGVMAAPNAWVSYALGSETLLESAPTDADLTVEAFEPKSGEDGKFDFTVSVEGVNVGGAATTEEQKEAVKENLKQVFGLEGGTTLEPGGMSSANVDITFGTPQDGKVKFTAGPKDADMKTFFMKVKVK